MPDLETLRSLVHASPIMHSQYLDNRHAILSTCLEMGLEGVYVDAYANLKSRPIELGWVRTNKMIIDFCASYDKWLKGWSPYPSLKSLPPSRVRWMAAFHLSVARPQVRLFVSWALENLSAFHRDIIPSWENGHIKISRSEEARILRAIYRHEVYHHLFGQNLGFRDGYDFESEVINGLFVELFHPWEVEAIGCFQVFVQGQWRDLLKPFIRDLDAPWRTVTMQYESGECFLRANWQIGLAAMVSSGLKYLTRIQALSSSKDRIHVTGRCINPLKYYESNLDWALYKDAQRLRRIRRFVNEKDKAQSKGLDMEFHGDSLPAEGPPLPWVLAFGGRYANIYGNDFELREKELGWVMWDAKRWSDTGREFYDKRSIHLL
ncbi:hypothetical protein F4678DRAFT_472736 [Xylaria arbuscula]|nr:hypothetical protein F4678DRAFT_472736 [Xylaria arbuscula]